jgi:manganese transport protein
MITRTAAILPAVLVISLMGEEQVMGLLVFSQVILSLQLPFAVIPLIKFTSSRTKMGPFVSPRWVVVLAGIAATIILLLNGTLLYQQLHEWISESPNWGWLIATLVLPPVAGLVVLLGWMIFRRDRDAPGPTTVSAAEIAASATAMPKRFRRIGVALEAAPRDSVMLAEAVTLARLHRADLVLMHVVDGVGGQWHGEQTGDFEGREDERYLDDLAQRLRDELGDEVGEIRIALGYGDVPKGVRDLVKHADIDFLVMGGHGHRGVFDWLHGETISTVRHGLKIPVLAVR